MCKQRGYSREDSKAVLKTRPAETDAKENKNALTGCNDADTSTSVMAKRKRTLVAEEHPTDEAKPSMDKRQRREALRTAPLADVEVVKEHAQW